MSAPRPESGLIRAEALPGIRGFALTLAVLDAGAVVLSVGTAAARGAPVGAVELAVLTFAFVAVPAGVYVWIVRRAPSGDRQLLGAVAIVVAVGAMSAYYDVARLDVVGTASRPSWVCVLLLLHALLVPAPAVLHALLVGVASVYWVAGAVAGHAFGMYPQASTPAVVSAAVSASIPTWLCGFVALLVVQRNRVERARYERALRDLERVGSYTLEAKLGEGGMGEVWRADHAFLARPAAVKIIRPEVLGGLKAADARARDRARLALGRFEREAKATAQLTSAHTIRVYDFGRGPNETFFYVMELLDGLDLRSLVLRYGPQPQARVRHILLQACDSLAEAHDRGMVHRDIKPANLFLCRSGKTLDHVKVLDFGLVRSDPGAKPEGVDTLPRLTRQGIISGSPGFMSPEQAEGADDLDRRADIYALGCVAYFLLTGVEPFEHDNPMVVLMQQIGAPPLPIRDRRPRSRVDPAFEALIARMMAKRRAERPSSADELIGLLRALQLPADWTQEAARKWWDSADVPVVKASFVPADAEGQRMIRRVD